MINLFLALFRAFFSLLKDPGDLAIENLALRQQLIVFKRLQPRPQLQRRDRLFWVWLSKVWEGWRESLIIVKPETVISWHRQGFRLFWTRISQGKGAGRPGVSPKVKALIKQMAEAKSIVGSATHSWRIAETGLRHLRTSSLSPDAETQPATFSDVAYIPRQPLPRASRDRLLHGTNGYFPGAVCLRGPSA